MGVRFTDSNAIEIRVEPGCVVLTFECGQTKVLRSAELSHLADRLKMAAESAVAKGQEAKPLALPVIPAGIVF